MVGATSRAHVPTRRVVEHVATVALVGPTMVPPAAHFRGAARWLVWQSIAFTRMYSVEVK